MTFGKNEQNLVGIAWMGSVCSEYKGYRASIGAYVNSDIQTSKVNCIGFSILCKTLIVILSLKIVVHQIAHNLGIANDFEEIAINERKCEEEIGICTNKGGVMDTYQVRFKISQASISGTVYKRIEEKLVEKETQFGNKFYYAKRSCADRCVP